MTSIHRQGKVALAALLVLALGCAEIPRATEVQSEHDPAFDFSQVHSWRFRIDKGPAREELDLRIRAETRAQLQKKGLRELPADGTPDVLVSYAAGAADTLTPGFVVGPTWYGGLAVYPGQSSMVTGGVLIEMGDPKTGNAVWVGTYIMRGNNPQAMQLMFDRAEQAVRGALGEYPPR